MKSRLLWKATAVVVVALATLAVNSAVAGFGLPVRGEFAGTAVGDQKTKIEFDVYRTEEGEKRARFIVQDLLLVCDGTRTRESFVKHTFDFQDRDNFGAIDEGLDIPFQQYSTYEVRGELLPRRKARGFVDYEFIGGHEPDCTTGGPVQWRAKKFPPG